MPGDIHVPAALPDHVKLREAGGVTIVECFGSFMDPGHNYFLRDQLLELIRAGSTLVLLMFADDALWTELTLDAILRARNLLRELHGQFKLVVAGEYNRKILQVTRLAPTLEVFPTEQEALASFTRRQDPSQTGA